MMFLTNRRVIFAYLSCTVMTICTAYKQNFMTTYLTDSKNFSDFYNGLTLSFAAFCYVISATSIGFLVDKAPRRVFLMMTFVVLTISNLLMGPSETLQLPD